MLNGEVCEIYGFAGPLTSTIPEASDRPHYRTLLHARLRRLRLVCQGTVVESLSLELVLLLPHLLALFRFSTTSDFWQTAPLWDS